MILIKLYRSFFYIIRDDDVVVDDDEKKWVNRSVCVHIFRIESFSFYINFPLFMYC